LGIMLIINALLYPGSDLQRSRLFFPLTSQFLQCHAKPQLSKESGSTCCDQGGFRYFARLESEMIGRVVKTSLESNVSTSRFMTLQSCLRAALCFDSIHFLTFLQQASTPTNCIPMNKSLQGLYVVHLVVIIVHIDTAADQSICSQAVDDAGGRDGRANVNRRSACDFHVRVSTPIALI